MNLSKYHSSSFRWLTLLLLLFLVACGGNDGANSTENAAATSPSSETSTNRVTTEVTEPTAPTQLRLGVSLTPQELQSFQAALTALDEAHPEWEIILETTPQDGIIEKMNTQIAGNTLPDVVRVQGLQVQQWVRQNAFLDLTSYITASGLDLNEFYPGPLAQFEWQKSLWGLPDTAAPDVVFYNKAMFDAAGVAYPTDEWTFEDMHAAALQLTLDSAGNNATSRNFNPDDIVQWGWNGGLTFFWQRHLVRPFGGDFCANEDCTLMSFTSPETIAAVQWWADLTSLEHATLYDPYGGSQTGVPGDPFISGKAAMGLNGFFAVGQLNGMGTIDYDVAQPFLGQDGQRYTPLSTNGYVISANSKFPQEAWELILALLEPDFLAQTWGQPGHSVPARRAAADSILNPAIQPTNQQAILQAMEYGTVFQPYTASAFATYGATAEFFTKAMKGEMPVADAMAAADTAANTARAPDREGQ